MREMNQQKPLEASECLFLLFSVVKGSIALWHQGVQTAFWNLERTRTYLETACLFHLFLRICTLHGEFEVVLRRVLILDPDLGSDKTL